MVDVDADTVFVLNRVLVLLHTLPLSVVYGWSDELLVILWFPRFLVVACSMDINLSFEDVEGSSVEVENEV